MVFDPTFHEISNEADELPDLDGQDDAPPLEGEIEEDELPPYGEE
ncbi:MULTISPECIES: hypothetical protein [Microbacterium]|nr:hypothetical protein [Microbacterium trichothecenolyticum]MDR7185634.1 hypothetical protein [Microbacterium trichothecenolyticum]